MASQQDYAQESKMDESEISLRQRLIALLICSVLFLAIYNASGFYASGLEQVSSFVFPFEKYIPFLPWMIIPYMSSGLFFALVFFIVKQKEELNVLFRRMIFITVVSGICFFLFPLKFSFPKPSVDSAFLNFFFRFLNTWDTNFNQAPSLHVSYACVFWSVLSPKLNGYKKIVLDIWIFLMAVSTLTVYQHHLIDVITALVLVCITFYIFPNQVGNK